MPAQAAIPYGLPAGAPLGWMPPAGWPTGTQSWATPAPPGTAATRTADIEAEARRQIDREEFAAQVKIAKGRLSPPTVERYDEAKEAADAAAAMAQKTKVAGQIAGAAGVEGAGAAGMAAAAGPAAIAVLAVKQIKDDIANAAEHYNDITGMMPGLLGKAVNWGATKVGDVVRSPGQISKFGADVTATAAEGNNAVAVGKVYTGLSDVAEKMPIFGAQLKLVSDTAGQVVASFHTVVEAFLARGKELSGYNPDLAISYAQADVKMLMADIREANQLGPGIARMNDTWTKFSLELREMLLPIKKFLVENLADFLEWGKERIDKLVERVIWMGLVFEEIPDTLQMVITGNFKDLAKLWTEEMPAIFEDRLERWRKRGKESEDMDQFLGRFLAMLDRSMPLMPPGNWEAMNPVDWINQRLNVPLVAGDLGQRAVVP